MHVDLSLCPPRIEHMRDRGRQVEGGGHDGLFVAETFGNPIQRLGVASQQRDALRGGAQDPMAALVPDELLEQLSVVDESWEAAISPARERYDGVADRLVLRSSPPLHVLADEMAAPGPTGSAQRATTS